MNKRTITLYFFLSIFLLAQQAAAASSPNQITGQAYTETIPQYDARLLGYEPIPARLVEQGGGSYPPISKDGPTQSPPNTAVGYTITLANYESTIHTYHLTAFVTS
jgi:hypothetical protein